MMKNHILKNEINIFLFSIIYNKILIILSATSSGVSIISFTTLAGAPVGIASASFTLIFSLAKGITKILLETTRNKKKMYDKIHNLAESKVSSIEKLISKALSDVETSHEEFIINIKKR